MVLELFKEHTVVDEGRVGDDCEVLQPHGVTIALLQPISGVIRARGRTDLQVVDCIHQLGVDIRARPSVCWLRIHNICELLTQV